MAYPRVGDCAELYSAGMLNDEMQREPFMPQATAWVWGTYTHHPTKNNE